MESGPVRKTRQIFVVLADDTDREALARVPGYAVHEVEVPVEHWRPMAGFDVVGYLDRCRAYLERRPVDGVVSFHDLGDLIAAALAEELGLPGPGAEAVFLCLHKLYTRLATGSTVRCQPLPLDGPPPDGLAYPCYVKPPWLKMTLLQRRVDSATELEAARALARRHYPAWARQYLPLFERCVDRSRYPLATAEMLLAEELVEGEQVTVEGWVADGEAGVWAITDTNAYPASGCAFDNFSLPSRKPDAVQAELARAALEAIRRTGFARGCFNAELWWRDGEPVLTELNGRSAASFDGLYNRCLTIGDGDRATPATVFENTVRLACGQPPTPAPRLNGVVGGQFNFLTFGYGRAADLIDCPAAEEAGVSLFVDPDDEIEPLSDLGTVLAQVELFGPEYAAVKRRADDLRRRLLKRPEESPW